MTKPGTVPIPGGSLNNFLLAYIFQSLLFKGSVLLSSLIHCHIPFLLSFLPCPHSLSLSSPRLQGQIYCFLILQPTDTHSLTDGRTDGRREGVGTSSMAHISPVYPSVANAHKQQVTAASLALLHSVQAHGYLVTLHRLSTDCSVDL